MRANRRELRLKRGASAGRASSAAAAAPTSAIAGPARAASFAVTALLVVTPLLVIPDAKEAFRLVQGLACGWLGLASLTIAAFALRDTGPITLTSLWRRPAIRALTPLFLIVALGGLFTSHPAHFRAAFADFAIGVACLAGWSLAFDPRTLRRLLWWTIPSAVLVALLGLDQYAGWFGLLDGLHVEAPTARLRITSTIGNPGDLASLVVLPALVALSRLRAAATRLTQIALGLAITIMSAIIVATATLAAAVALLVGAAVWASLVWLTARTRDRRSLATPLIAVALAAIVIAGAVAVSAPLRTRVIDKVTEVSRGDLNALLTGRLDGWRVAWAMLWHAPVTGVGQGAFRAEFADTRLALTAQGVPFFPEQMQVILATPHNEALSVAAEQGLPGLIALAWAVWWLLAAARRLSARGAIADAENGVETRALAWAGLAALAILCTVSFPLHLASVAYPWLLFFAWIFRASEVSA